MGRKAKVEDALDLQNIEVGVVPTAQSATQVAKNNSGIQNSHNKEVNCLRNERIILRHVPKQSGIIVNPKHILYGGMAESAVRYFTVPLLSSGAYVNVLTNSEKEYLEMIMGLEYNALSVYRKVDNYWDNYMVRLTKQDNFLDLSSPEDYIKYKVLLANKDIIAPSIRILQDTPKATYQFVIVSEGDENRMAKSNMNATMQCYKEFGKIEDDIDVLKVLVETIDGRPISSNTTLSFLQTKVNSLIQADSKLFLRVISDDLLNVKVLIRKSIEKGLIVNRGTYLYLKEGNVPLCNDGELPTLNLAAQFLNLAVNQPMKFALEAKLK